MWRALCVILLALFIGLPAQHQAVAAEASNKQQSATNQTAPADPHQQSPKEYRPRCDHPQSREESNLCAQWGAVFAARDANRLTQEANSALRDANTINASTLWWTRIGFGAVLLTLIATAWAAWAAGDAARAANRSVDRFESAERGFLVPKVSVNSPDVVTISLQNTGRTAVTILHADLCCVESKPTEPVETFFNEPGTHRTDVLIGPDKPYIFGPGPMRIPHQSAVCWIYGGAIYRTVFGQIDWVRGARVSQSRQRAILCRSRY
jgi:hypothetical protein